MPSESINTGNPFPQGRGEDPLYHFTRIYLAFLQGLFQQFDTGSLKWSSDERMSEIWISDQSPIPKERIDQRPAIVTMRGPAQFANLSLDNLQKQSYATGMRRHTDLVACTMSLNCIAKNGVEAQRIAWIVFSNIRRFKRLLQRNGIHKIGDDVSMGGESPPGAIVQPEGDIEAVMVTVQSPFYFQWTEEITPTDATMLSHIEMHMVTHLGPVDSTQARQPDVTLLRGPTIGGVPVRGPSAPIEPDNPIDVLVKT